MTHSIGSKPLLLKNFNLHEILNYSAKFSSATGNRSVAANVSKGLKLFDDKFVSKISFTGPDCLVNDDIFIQGFVKAEMKKRVTYKPCVQIRTTCQSIVAVASCVSDDLSVASYRSDGLSVASCGSDDLNATIAKWSWTRHRRRQTRVLMPVKTRRVEEQMHVESVVAQNHPDGVVGKLGEWGVNSDDVLDHE
ncbi:hypothetical protein TNCV_3233881 [Trichonephila clavipes]|nr:hypothetical protein TNCV_3233881 [Trichonephila clavipes]